MAFDNTNRGTLSKNDRKEKPTHADYRGQITVDGKDYWLDAWLKDGPKGKFISLSVKPKLVAGDSQLSVSPAAAPSFDADIPF